MSVTTGHGATLGFGTESAFSPSYTSIGGWTADRPSIDTSNLATTGARTMIPGDLFSVGQFSAPFIFDIGLAATGQGNSLDDLLYTSGAAHEAETVTVTYPNSTSSTVASTVAFVTGAELGELTTDTLVTASITVDWGDWPTITDNAA